MVLVLGCTAAGMSANVREVVVDLAHTVVIAQRAAWAGRSRQVEAPHCTTHKVEAPHCTAERASCVRHRVYGILCCQVTFTVRLP